MAKCGHIKDDFCNRCNGWVEEHKFCDKHDGRFFYCWDTCPCDEEADDDDS